MTSQVTTNNNGTDTAPPLLVLRSYFELCKFIFEIYLNCSISIVFKLH